MNTDHTHSAIRFILLTLTLFICLAAAGSAHADCPEDLRNCQRELGITYDDLHICSSENEVLKNANIRLAAQNDYLAQENTQLKTGQQGYIDTIQLLTGQLAAISATLMTPANIDFGAVSVGAGGQTRTITVTANKDMTLGAITLGGAQPGDFTHGGTCTDGAIMAAGAGCSINVSFNPTATGNRSATLTVATTSPVATLTTTLTGSVAIATSSIVIDPNSATTLYAGMDGAGVYKSIDSGASWNPATGQPANKRIKAVVIKPGDSTKLYAATYGGGLFKTTDAASTWSACANTNLSNLNLISLTIDGTGKLYAGTESGVFVSTDGCGTWTAMNSGLP